MHSYIYIYIYMYMYTHICVYTCMCRSPLTNAYADAARQDFSTAWRRRPPLRHRSTLVLYVTLLGSGQTITHQKSQKRNSIGKCH